MPRPATSSKGPPSSHFRRSRWRSRATASSRRPDMDGFDYTFAGLPLHVLLVHAVIVATPLVALALVFVSAWPAARRVLWLPVLIGAALLLPLGLVTIEAGKWLEQRVPPAPLDRKSTRLNSSHSQISYAVFCL